MKEYDELEMETQDLLAGVMTLFGELFILNLDNGTYSIYKMDRVMSRVVTGTSFEEFNLKYGNQLVHPDDWDKFYDAFRLVNLRNSVKKGNKRVVAEIRRKTTEGEYHWCELVATLIEVKKGPSKMIMTFRDIDDLRAARRDERYAIQRFTNAVNNTYDAIYEGEILSDQIHIWKSPGNKIKDLAFVDSIDGQVEWSANTSVHPDYKAEFKRRLDRKNLEKEFRSGKQELYFEIPRLGEDGAYRWFSFQIQLLNMADQAIHLMYYIKDIEDVKKTEKQKQEQLQQALLMAEQANAAKTDFLSRMSHDIRTPMNAIIGMTTIAGENAGNPKAVKECLKNIDVSAKYLLSLINDILDMSKIESGKMSVFSQKLDFRKLVHDVTIICRNQADKKMQSFKTRISSNTARYYLGDSLRLNQIFINLTGNALKYTQEGGIIRFSVDAGEVVNGRQQITVKVSDNGIGMSEEFLDRMFEPFEQENNSRAREFEGTGLGLSITLNLVRLMGGTITATSRVGRGSTFTVILPLGVVGEADGTEEKNGKRERAGKRRGVTTEHHFHHERILLVEDNEMNLEITRTLLEMQELVVETARDGLEAVKMFCNSEPGYYSAIIMDIRMPVMDGLEATEKIRSSSHEDASRIPIIAMTANAFQDEQEEAELAGISDYLTKPVDAEDMYSHLENLL